MRKAQGLQVAGSYVFIFTLTALLLASSIVCSSRFAFADEAASSESEENITGEIEISQRDINKVGKQTRRGQCLCYSYAYAQTITTGKVHSWSEYSAGGVSARWFPDLFSYKTYGSKQSTLKAVYKAVTKGKPVVLHLRMNKGGQHWVAVTGYKGSDASKLELSDFLALDSVGTLPDEPSAISEDTYSLYLDSNNVRVSKTAASFAADEANEASADSTAGTAGTNEGSAVANENSTSASVSTDGGSTNADTSVNANEDSSSVNANEDLADSTKDPADTSEGTSASSENSTKSAVQLNSFSVEERKIISQRSNPNSGAEPEEGVISQFLASLVA